MLGMRVVVTSCVVLDKQSNRTRLHFVICKISLVIELSDVVHAYDPRTLGDKVGVLPHI